MSVEASSGLLKAFPGLAELVEAFGLHGCVKRVCLLYELTQEFEQLGLKYAEATDTALLFLDLARKGELE